MKRCKRDMGMMLTGIALGALLTGGAAAAGILAEPAWSPIYVNGRQVQMTAYNIAGNNYVKLRDIGKAVGFNVYYQDGVQVDSATPYTGEAPAQTPPAESISVSSYKGNTLKAGDRSGLMISPSGPAYTVTSSDPAVVAVEQVSGRWVAVAKSPGSAIITVSNSSGEKGSLMLTINSAAPGQAADSPVDLNANMEIRQEMIRLINQVRQENGVAELQRGNHECHTGYLYPMPHRPRLPRMGGPASLRLAAWWSKQPNLLQLRQKREYRTESGAELGEFPLSLPIHDLRGGNLSGRRCYDQGRCSLLPYVCRRS